MGATLLLAVITGFVVVMSGTMFVVMARCAFNKKQPSDIRGAFGFASLWYGVTTVVCIGIFARMVIEML